MKTVAQYQRAKQQDRRARGLCAKCDEPSTEYLCVYHKDKMKTYQDTYHQRRRGSRKGVREMARNCGMSMEEIQTIVVTRLSDDTIALSFRGGAVNVNVSGEKTRSQFKDGFFMADLSLEQAAMLIEQLQANVRAPREDA